MKKSLFVLLAVLLLAGFIPAFSNATWFNTSDAIKLGSNYTSAFTTATLTNFPVPVNYSSLTKVSSQKMNSTGFDSRFTNGTEAYALPCELQAGTNNSANQVTWVSLPNVYSSSTSANDFYNYYNDNQTVSPQCAMNYSMWDNYGYTGVFHAPVSTSNADAKDSGRTNKNFTASAGISIVSGYFGKAWYMTTNNTAGLTGADCINYMQTSNVEIDAIIQKNGTWTGTNEYIFHDGAGWWNFGAGSATQMKWITGANTCTLAFDWTSDSKPHVVTIRMMANSTVDAWLDGTQVCNTTNTAMGFGAGDLCYFGGQGSGAITGANVTVQEVRWHNVSQSDDYVRQLHNSWLNGTNIASAVEQTQAPANTAPAFQWTSSNVTNGSEFKPETVRIFANFTDDTGVTSVVMTFNSVNYTMAGWNGTNASGVFNANISGLGVGTYVYNFTASDGTLANSSQDYSLVIAQNSSWNLIHTLNGSVVNLVGAYPATVSIACSQNSADVLALTEWRNATNVSSGTSISYSETPKASDYNFTCFSAGDANYSSKVNQLFLNVSKGDLNLTEHLNGTNNNLAITYPQAFNVTGWAANASAFTPTLTILEGGVGIDAGSNPTNVNTSRAAGAYNFSLFFSGNENYSSGIQTWTGTVNLGSINITEHLNGSNNNFTFTYPQMVNITSWSNVSSLTLIILENGTGIAAGSNPTNVNTSRGVATYNFSSYFAGNQNYSSSIQTFYANVLVNSTWTLNHTLNLTVQNLTGDWGITIVDNCTNNAGVSLTLAHNQSNVSTGSSIGFSANPPAGTRNFTCFGFNANYSYQESQLFAFIAKNSLSLNLTLNGSSSDTPFVFGNTVNASGTSNVTSFTLQLYKNATALANSTNPSSSNESLRAGDFNYTLSYQGNENYSSASQTFFANVSKAQSAIALYMNGKQESPVIALTGITVNASAYSNVTGFNVTLYRNTTAVAFGTNFAEESNQSRTSAETLNYTGCFPETQNYSASCTTFFAFYRENTLGGGGGGAGASGGTDVINFTTRPEGTLGAKRFSLPYYNQVTPSATIEIESVFIKNNGNVMLQVAPSFSCTPDGNSSVGCLEECKVTHVTTLLGDQPVDTALYLTPQDEAVVQITCKVPDSAKFGQYFKQTLSLNAGRVGQELVLESQDIPILVHTPDAVSTVTGFSILSLKSGENALKNCAIQFGISTNKCPSIGVQSLKIGSTEIRTIPIGFFVMLVLGIAVAYSFIMKKTYFALGSGVLLLIAIAFTLF